MTNSNMAGHFFAISKGQSSCVFTPLKGVFMKEASKINEIRVFAGQIEPAGRMMCIPGIKRRAEKLGISSSCVQ